jgi:hypothetical protein
LFELQGIAFSDKEYREITPVLQKKGATTSKGWDSGWNSADLSR